MPDIQNLGHYVTTQSNVHYVVDIIVADLIRAGSQRTALLVLRQLAAEISTLNKLRLRL
jgi:hypothetical protein